MNGREKSDSAEVAVKPANKTGMPAAEQVEPRAGTEGNAIPQSTSRTQGRADASQARDRIRVAARRNKKEKFTALLHHVTPEALRDAFDAIAKNAAAGIDGITWQTSSVSSRTCMTESRAGRIGRRRAGGFTYPNRTDDSVRSRLLRLRIRLSNERWPRC